MGIFDIFKKKDAGATQQATLDSGLEKSREGIFSKISRAVAGKSKVDEEVLDQLEEILITADVGVETTLRIIDRIEARVARDKYLGTAELNTILRDEVTALLAEAPAATSSAATAKKLVPGPKERMTLSFSSRNRARIRRIRSSLFFILPPLTVPALTRRILGSSG